jgi:hypothetical protein
MRTLLMNQNIGELKAVIIKAQDDCQGDYKADRARYPFLLPVKRDDCLVFEGPIMGA